MAKKKTTRKKATRRPATRKTAKKTAKRTTKKTTARSTTTGPKPTRITSARGAARSKSEVLGVISEHVGITKREAGQVFDVMSEMIAADLKRGAVGQFKVPGMMKITVQRKPATKARKGINPFTGEPTIFKAKPARNVVKVRPLKGLKELVG